MDAALVVGRGGMSLSLKTMTTSEKAGDVTVENGFLKFDALVDGRRMANSMLSAVISIARRDRFFDRFMSSGEDHAGNPWAKIRLASREALRTYTTPKLPGFQHRHPAKVAPHLRDKDSSDEIEFPRIG